MLSCGENSPNMHPVDFYSVIAALILVKTAAAATYVIPDSTASSVIYRDVAILGGGASGAHAAVRLRQDFNKTIVVVEKNTKLVSTTTGDGFAAYKIACRVVMLANT